MNLSKTFLDALKSPRTKKSRCVAGRRRKLLESAKVPRSTLRQLLRHLPTSHSQNPGPKDRRSFQGCIMKLFEAQLFKRLQCRPIELPAKEQYIPISPISSLLTWTRRTSYYRMRQSQDNMICDGGSYQASSRWSHL